nr:hypothetical protein [Pseudomonas sp.]
MSKPFDMELLLVGVLTGSHSTRLRHLHQAIAIQAAIAKRWHIDNPWAWQRKHLRWFLTTHIKTRSTSTKYYYWLTMNLILARLGKAQQTTKKRASKT